jgi:hypothetical protein
MAKKVDKFKQPKLSADIQLESTPIAAPAQDTVGEPNEKDQIAGTAQTSTSDRNEQKESGCSASPPEAEQNKPTEPPWSEFLKDASQAKIRIRFERELRNIVAGFGEKLAGYCCIYLLNVNGNINTFDLDQIYAALRDGNPKKEHDVLLFLLSSGGSIEPAYQISKLCKSFAKSKFVVAIPRQAKSAATLIAIGADEIHMSKLGQLGPIDPQLGGLPALGVAQALKSIASLSQDFPGSAEMFARYLRLALTVEQIGYCDRISESACQYAERLLLTKPLLAKAAQSIAKELVYEYKHHGFVIDFDEAQNHLGSSWLMTDTTEIHAAEEIYKLFDLVNLFLSIFQNRYLWVTGGASNFVYMMDTPARPQ